MVEQIIVENLDESFGCLPDCVPESEVWVSKEELEKIYPSKD